MTRQIPPFARALPYAARALPLAAMAARAAARNPGWAGVGHRGRGHQEHHGGPGPWGRGGFEKFGPWGRGGWGPPFGFPGGRGPRARRGDIRAAILHLLADRPMHGYEMIRELQERSGGAWRPSAGSIYPTLQLLEDEGLVTANEENGRKLYSLTDAGREALDERGAQAPWEEFADTGPGQWHELRRAGMGLAGAVMQATHVANEDQLQRVLDTINEARSRIYRILGEDEPPRDTGGSDTDASG